ncbi:hypothetical protein C8R43DRAFT_956168 [Mycena crocata]|nr:hypothetical protein C8R43DRAFT_956168 [Mycena crocata]
MTSNQVHPLPVKDNPPDRNKPSRHAEAQSRYRQRKLEETREKARQRMAKLRSQRTPEEKKEAAERRREGDADYREYLRRRKFVKRFGYEDFLEAYFPLYALYGEKHFPGLRWTDKPEKKGKKAKAGASSNPNNQGNKKKTARDSAGRNKQKRQAYLVIFCFFAVVHETREAWSLPLRVRGVEFRVVMYMFGSGGYTWEITASIQTCISIHNFLLYTMPCHPHFYFNDNYVSVKEHDKNPRKHWYLVLHVGIFTKKVDADAYCDSDDEDGPEIFFTRRRAQKRWDSHCDADHSHSDGEIVPDSEPEDHEDGDGAITDGEASVLRSPSPLADSLPRGGSKSPRKKLPLFRDDDDELPHSASAAMAPTTGNLPPASTKRADTKREPTVKREATVKREGTVKREPTMLPLYRDDSPPLTPSRKHSGGPKEAAASKRGRPSPAISTSIRSVSSISISTASSTTAAAASGREGASPTKSLDHPFRDLASSVSAGGRAPRVVVAPTAAPTQPAESRTLRAQARGGAPATKELRASSTAPRGAAPSSAAAPPRRAATAAPTRGSASMAGGGRGLNHFGRNALGKFLQPQVGEGNESGPGGGAQASSSTTAGAESPSARRLLFNNSTRRIYIDVEKAVREMSTTETVQVVEYADVKGYCEGKGGKLGV